MSRVPERESDPFAIMSSACDPLAPLQRWIAYTQHEVLQLKRELHECRQEVLATQKIQQQQLDSLQSQIRSTEQSVTEISEAVTELFQKQSQMQDLLLRLLSDCASLQTQTLPQRTADSEIPATQPYND